MKIGGFHKFSLIDYPGKIAAVLFTQGCNFRCPFCHNPELVLPRDFTPLIPEEEVFSFLTARKGQLDGVVITGGEPTLQDDLVPFISRLKEMGFAVKLDTNGSNPAVLRGLIEQGLVDFVAMDIKAPLAKYSFLSGVACDLLKIKESIETIIGSGLAHEFRTTLVKPLLSYDDIGSIMTLAEGSDSFRVQNFVNTGKMIDSSLQNEAQYSDSQVRELQACIERFYDSREKLKEPASHPGSNREQADRVFK